MKVDEEGLSARQPLEVREARWESDSRRKPIWRRSTSCYRQRSVADPEWVLSLEMRMPPILMKLRELPVFLLLLALATTVLADSVPTAQPDPALARGFSPEQAYQGFTELDHLNAFNGNLVLPLPLGRNYRGLDKAAGKRVLAKRHNFLVDPASGQEIDGVVSERTEYAGRGGRISRRIVSAARSLLQSNSIAFETSFFYDLLGNVDTQVYPRCLHACSSPLRTVFYDYQRGRLTGVPGYVSSIGYHPNGMLARVRHANGAVYTIANDPRSLRRPRSITLMDSSGTPSRLDPFGYDGASNMTSSGPEFYVFDGVSRLVEATFGSGAGQSYTFDAFGNMRSITSTSSGSTHGRPIGVSSSTNRLTSAACDAAGNVTLWNGNAYQYDAVSMMTSSNGSQLYAYDTNDMRVMLYDATLGEERFRLRGLGQEVLREVVRTAAGWQWTRDYVFRDGEILASITSGEGTRHQHPNHVGTPRVITDASGRIVASQLLRPFGEEASGSGAATGFLKFTGHERDFNGPSAEDHLDYMKARYYSPHLGRFFSPDRVSGKPETPQSWNRYAYALNNPIKFVDPDGEIALGAVVKVAIKGGDLATTVAGIVADAKTIVSSDASFADRAFAAVSIASEIISPVSVKEVRGTGRTVEITSGVPGGTPRTFQPGPRAGESIPARSSSQRFTKEERAVINRIGDTTGCHTCGARDPGTKGGNFGPDHQPPPALNKEGASQRLFPHCINCSREQGLAIAREMREQP